MNALLRAALAVLLLAASFVHAACPAGYPRSTPDSDFTDAGNGTVRHIPTGLVWKRCAEGQTWNGSTCTGTATSYNWQQAFQRAASVNNGDSGTWNAGQTDWRVPNQNELRSIAERGCYSPSINTTQFPTTPLSDFWSGSPSPANSAKAWAVTFYDGNEYWYRRDRSDGNNGYVRLVRAGQSFYNFDAGDATPPTLSSVGVSGITATAATLTATSNEAATGYWVVVARNAAAPTSAQVKAGANYGSVTVVASGNGAMTANTAKNFNIASLSPGTNYDLYLVAEDGSTNLSASPTKVQFQTGKLDQTISFSSAPSIVVGGTGTVSATGGGSGNAVTFSSQTTGVCTISGSTVTGVTAGTCTIAADQAGNSNYNAAAQVTQSFGIIATYAVTATASPSAAGTAGCAPNPVTSGGTSTCTATADTGYTFAGWTGDCAGQEATCTLSDVTSAKSSTANFTLNTYAVAAAASPSAGGSASCTPNPVSHGGSSTCTATANPGYAFVDWSGACVGPGATCTLTGITGPRSSTANFRQTTLTVTNANDSGAGSLRQAIADAGSGDTIVFAAGIAGQTITLASTLTLDKNLTIDGSALASQITLSGNGAVRIVYINAGVSGTLKNLTLANGFSSLSASPNPSYGGAIFNNGTLTLLDSTLRDNRAYTGSAITSYGTTLTVKNSTFANNTIVTGGVPGTIYTWSGSIENSTFAGNNGGTTSQGSAVSVGGGTMAIANSTFAGNTNNGGAIVFAYSGSTITLRNSLLTGNLGANCGGNSGTLTASADNIADDATCNGATQKTVGEIALQSLASNGGPTQTMALAANSAAINAGNDATCAATDQRGTTRPQGGHCDVGAFEQSNTAPSFVGGATTLTVAQSAGATDIKDLLHVSDSDPGQTLTWSQSGAPSHGTLSFSGASASSGSTDIAPGGSITYTPTAGYVGSDSFTVQVSDGTATATRTINVTVGSALTVVVSPNTVGGMLVGTPFSQTFTASGGYGTYTFDLSAGSLPPGLTLGSDGLLSGTPSAAGTFSFTVQATDSSTGSGPFSGLQALTATVSPAPVDGVCGTDHGKTLTTAPVNLCSASWASPVAAGSTAYTWNCSGTNGGRTADCSAMRNYIVTATAGTGGSIGPSQTVAYSARPSFTVTPNTGYTASVGGTCGGTLVGNTYTTLSVTASCTVAASFTLNTYSVTATANTGGSASCTPNPANHGGTSTCTAAANSGYAFTGWSGDCAGQGATCTLNAIVAAKSSTASFSQNTYAVTATASPSASGSASCTPTPASHGGTSTCTAVANSGYAFAGWTGDCAGRGATCTLTNISSAKNSTARFQTATVGRSTIPTQVAGVTASLGVTGCQTITSATFIDAPAGAGQDIAFPFGVLDFDLGGCSGMVTVTVTYSQDLPTGANFYKWRNGERIRYPATINGNSVTFTVTDGGEGDDDGAVNNSIRDPGGIGLPAALGSAQGIPTLSEWGLAILSLLIAALTALRTQRR